MRPITWTRWRRHTLDQRWSHWHVLVRPDRAACGTRVRSITGETQETTTTPPRPCAVCAAKTPPRTSWED